MPSTKRFRSSSADSTGAMVGSSFRQSLATGPGGGGASLAAATPGAGPRAPSAQPPGALLYSRPGCGAFRHREDSRSAGGGLSLQDPVLVSGQDRSEPGVLRVCPRPTLSAFLFCPLPWESPSSGSLDLWVWPMEDGEAGVFTAAPLAPEPWW